MKQRIAILSALVCACGAFGAHASECTGAGCRAAYDMYGMRPTIGEPTPLGAPEYIRATTTMAEYESPMMMAAPTSVYPAPMAVMPNPIALVPHAGEMPFTAWDGTIGTFVPRKFDKTVDWRDGAPLWDDSVSHYRDRDFSDWYSPMDIYYYSDKADFVTRDVVESLLTPTQGKKTVAATQPVESKPTDPDCVPARPTQKSETCAPCGAQIEPPQPIAPPTAVVIQPIPVMFDDGCPFDTEMECAIWRKKPMVRETVSPRSPKVRADKMDAFIAAARCDDNISLNDPVAAPLLDRYKMLMSNARACCTDGMVHALKTAGASDGLVYKFMADDANFYNLGARCLMTTDAEFDEKYPNTATAAVAADVRNGCLCRNRDWFYAMLAPFSEVYAAVPEFKDTRFWYTYTDGLQRQITVSVNTDIQNVLNQLALCP